TRYRPSACRYGVVLVMDGRGRDLARFEVARVAVERDLLRPPALRERAEAEEGGDDHHDHDDDHEAATLLGHGHSGNTRRQPHQSSWSSGAPLPGPGHSSMVDSAAPSRPPGTA